MLFTDKRSVKGYYWRLQEYDMQKVNNIKQRYNLTETVARLISLKDIDISNIEIFLNPTIRNTLNNPMVLKDMDKGVDVIYNSILNKEKIVIYGDYDVDGITSTTLLRTYFRCLNIDVIPYIPNRINDGFGLNSDFFIKNKDKNIKLVITVDCGISNNDAVDVAKSLGYKIVITDHHLGGEQLPLADAVINPNRNDEECSEYKNLAGVGVAYLLLICLNRKLRDNEYFKKNNLKEPDLIQFLDLVALGTVCDVMPLTKLNRAFVSQGLKIIKQRKNVGISSLITNSNINEEINTYHLGFILGPRLNASGRVGEAIISSHLLYSNDKTETSIIADKLEKYNIDRQKLELVLLSEVVKIIEKENISKDYVIFLKKDDWSEGIVGILASRIKDRYDKPVFIATKNKDTYKVSCRSVKGIDIGSVILEMKTQGLIIDGGGHAMAGGFNFKPEKFDSIKEFLNTKLEQQVINFIEHKEKSVELLLQCKSITLDLAKDIEKSMAPFGVANNKPKIILKDVVIVKTEIINKNQDCFKLLIGDKDGVKLTNCITAMCFRVKKDDVLYPIFKNGAKLNLLGEININNFREKESVQFVIDDVMF